MQKTAYASDYVGRDVEVGNIKGQIVDETKNLMIIQATGKKIQKIPKKDRIFNILIGNKVFTVEGNKIIMRPEDRTKRIIR